MRLRALGLLDRDHTLLVHLLHRLGDQTADVLVVVGRNGGYLLDLRVVRAHLLRLLAQRLYDRSHGLVDTALQIHRVGTCRYVLQTDTDDGLCQYRGGRRAVTGIVVGLRGYLLDHLGTHVCKRILQLYLLGYRYTILRDVRSTEFLVDDHIATLRAERHLHGVRQGIDTLLEKLSCLYIVFDFLCHNLRLCLFR